MPITTATLTRTAGAAAVGAGVLFAGIQVIHPADTITSVPTPQWAVTAALTFAMALLGLVGVTGLYLRNAGRIGRVGLAGYVLLSLFFVLTCSFTFTEALVLPALVDEAPTFVGAVLGMASGEGAADSVGALAAVGPLAGGLYLVGGVLFGVALYRKGRVARWAALLLAVGAVLSLLAAVLPHAIGRFAAVPVAVALVGLGLSLRADDGARSPVARSAPATAGGAVRRPAAS